MVSEITMIAPLGEPQNRVRCSKFIKIARKKNNTVFNFWGWRRKPSENLGQGMIEIQSTRALLEGSGHDNSNTKFKYIFWVAKVFFTTLRHRPKLVYALGLETALPVWVASKFSRHTQYIFDDPDRFIMLFPIPKILKKLISKFEIYVSEKSIIHITPSLDRYDYRNKKMREIPNTPTRAQVATARESVKTGLNPTPLTLYVNGMLTPTRGLNILSKLVKYCDEELDGKVSFHLATMIDRPEALEPFLKSQNVEYLGRLTQTESLAQYLRSHGVITLYDPSIEINRYAASNKWGDAIFTQTPIIVNKGIHTAQGLVKNGVAFEVDYSFEGLRDLVLDLIEHPQKLKKTQKNIAEYSKNFKYYDELVSDFLDELTE